MEFHRIDDPPVGDTIGDQNDAGGAVVIEVIHRHRESFVDVGPAAAPQVADAFQGLFDVLRRRLFPPVGEIGGAVRKGHDPIAIFRGHFPDHPGHPVGQGVKFRGHAPRGVEDIDVVVPVLERFEVEDRIPSNDDALDPKEILPLAKEFLLSMDKFWEKAGPELRWKFQKLIFPEDLEFDGKNFGTVEINKIIGALQQRKAPFSCMVSL